ncbi:MAG: hypothetical protein KME08_06690 [Aphanothece sp. CMT-3BRIN-NPC111]|nr:hypothetical protein [Aphanothece sp. CMT-3BRIN-NPC111]
MKHKKNIVATRVWLSRVTIVALLAGAIAGCNNGTSDKPDVVVVSPTTPASAPPAPAATSTAAVTPNATATTTSTTTAVSPTTAASPGTTTTTTTVIREPITDVVVISSAPEPQSLVGKRVQFTATNVLSVIGDRPFWVGRSNNERLVVVLDPALDKGNAESKVVIKGGQTLDLTGVLRPMPSAQTAQSQWGLTAAEAQGLQTQAVYLQADKINFRS